MRTSPPSTSSSRRSKSWDSSLAAGLGGLLVVLLLFPPPASLAAAPTLEDAIQRLETTYRGIRDLKASFEQAAFNKTLNQTLNAKGTLYLKKPGKLRWEYAAPTPQEIVSDGKRLWVYTPQLKQVNVSDAPSALAGPAG